MSLNSFSVNTVEKKLHGILTFFGMSKRFVFLTFMLNSIAWMACEYETIPGPVNCEENPVVVELVMAEESNCELMDGSIEVVASGGSGSYQFFIGEEEPQESPVFAGLAAGVYNVSAVDENDCTSTIQATVLNSEGGLNITITSTEAGCNTANGTLTVTATGGIAPFQFRIGGGTFTTNNTFSGLAPGNYELVAKDASGCEVTQAVKMRSGISFASSISPIIEASCAINDCHNGNQFPDFRQFKNIHDNAAQIKALTGDHTMPEDGTLTQAQINMIACWVDDGALAN
jgi:hypothetical protein